MSEQDKLLAYACASNGPSGFGTYTLAGPGKGKHVVIEKGPARAWEAISRNLTRAVFHRLLQP